MIRCSGTTRDGRPLLIVGLSRENTTRLHAGEPIQFDSSRFGIEGGPVLMLLAGETEADISGLLRQAGFALERCQPTPVYGDEHAVPKKGGS